MRYTSELVVAREAAEAGGVAALERFRRSIGIKRKPDSSPVTEADFASEAAILRRILQAFPSDGFLCEESGEKAGSSGRRWIIDPLDGTRAFLRGLPHWGVLVALEVEGRVEAGVANFPAAEAMYAAATGEGCTRNGKAIRCSDASSLAEATVQLGEISSIAALDPALFDGILRSGAVLRSYGDAYAGCLVLEGRSDAWIEATARAWDLAPFASLAREAGAVFTDWSGEESIDRGTGLLAPPALHRAIRELMTLRG
ncbi:MAG TPA: inositol monophosphatase family protein [Thermoanaerobaculia bacterium]|nr:inositol monophosphatase family protein [Thermoanaerobaculia bacterium]